MEGKPLRIKVTGDLSNPASIVVTNADTGERITNVIELDIGAFSRSRAPTIVLTVFGGELDLTGIAGVRQVIIPHDTL